MESKKFVNLSSNYKIFLSNCEKIIDKIELNENLTFNELNDLHKKIENHIELSELQISDINHLIENYDKSNNNVINLKKLVHLRNYYILTKILRCEQWKEYIIKLKLKCKSNLEINTIKNKQVEEAFIKLLEKYIGTWNTLNRFIKLDKKNNIKEIEIIDPDDYNYIFSLIN